ncbi:MAG: hypothetical protein V1775_04880 [Bacteroidota bacterium]
MNGSWITFAGLATLTVLCVNYWNKLVDFYYWCKKNSQYSLLAIDVILFIITAIWCALRPEMLEIFLKPSDKHLTLYSIAIPANITIILGIILIGLPSPQEWTVLDAIPFQNLKDYFAETSNEAIIESKYRAKKSCIAFATYWRLAFIFMVWIYISLLLSYFNDVYSISSFIPDFITNVFDVLSTVFFFGCLLILTQPTFVKDNNGIKFLMPKAFFYICVLGVGLIVFDAITLINAEFAKFKVLSSLLIGLFGAFTFARFTGRLDSKFIRTPGWIVIIFYFYAFLLILFPIIHSIQAFYCNIELLEKYKLSDWLLHKSLINGVKIILSITIATLYFLKLFIAIAVIWLFKTNKILLYFVRMNRYETELIRNDRIVQQVVQETPEAYEFIVMK